MVSARALGLIAGRGRFPLEVARALRRRGERVAAVAFRNETDPALEAEVDTLEWVYLGELGRLVEGLRAAGAGEAVMAGKIPKVRLYGGDLGALRPDPRALALLARLADRKDDTILRAIAAELEAEGLRLCTQTEVAPELFAGPGPLGSRRPSAAEAADVAFAWPIAKALGGLDIGQTVAVRERAVLAVEAIEGTDATIARAGALASGGIVVVKVAKPDQDLRFDMPAIGLDTLKALREARAAVLAFEAGRTVVLDREELAREADALGIAVIGVAAEGPEA